MSIFTIGITFAQVAPVVNLPHALFKTDNGEYQIQYNITNARLEATFVDIPARAFMFVINATKDGQLSVDLPRKIIDSTRDGKDRPYFVSLGDPTCCHKRIKVDEIRNNSETRIVTINFTKGLKQVQLSGTFFVENNRRWIPMNPYNGEWSPLKQWQLGVDSQDVICKNDLQLIIKARDDLPACVKNETIRKLVVRGWGIAENWIKLENFNDAIKYEINGGKMLSISAYSEYTNPSQPGETKNTMLFIRLDANVKTQLSITMPRDLIDAKIYTDDDSFFVLLNQIETRYDEIKTTFDRTLKFDIPPGINEIEIIGYGYYNDKLPFLPAT